MIGLFQWSNVRRARTAGAPGGPGFFPHCANSISRADHSYWAPPPACRRMLLFSPTQIITKMKPRVAGVSAPREIPTYCNRIPGWA